VTGVNRAIDAAAPPRGNARYRAAQGVLWRPWLRIDRLASCHRRPLPNLLIIGAQKAGTTTLFDLLAEQPEFVGSRVKEPQFLTSPVRFLPIYRTFFPLVDRHKPRPHVFEATPYYLFHPDVPRRAARLLGRDPGLRVIAILRDPIERARSHHEHNLRYGLEHLPFERAVDAEPTRLAQRGRAGRFAHRHHSYIARGMYAPQLARWFDAIGRERVGVWFFEELFEDAARGVGEVLDWLGVPVERRAPVAPRRSNAGSTREPLDATLRPRLHAMFEPDRCELESLLARRTPTPWLGSSA
jgi:hypothetical protein